MINWLKYKYIYLTTSAILIGVSIFSLFFWQLRPSIDFTGGTLIELSYQDKSEADQGKLRKSIQDLGVEVESIYSIGEDEIIVKSKFVDQENAKKIRQLFSQELADYKIVRFETVGATLGKELLSKTITAAIIAAFGMLTYIAWVFKNFRFGTAAVLALLHDTTILIGSFSLLGHFYNIEVDTLFVTAVLTTMSFSVHDTVVVFNKIREKTRFGTAADFSNVVNEALTETMVRSVNNSLTILFMLLALVLLGGETIRWFMVALLIGTVLGTYSSPFVAVPILTLLYREK